ncbi:MAG: MarR family transcriptional regulator [Ancalomicrobiaceae bacterium]|nr:MarR family transcriptional regulator [Ancalomicrobiaceae bacterium]
MIPAPGEGKRGEAGYLGYLLRQAAHANRLKMETILADLQVTPPQFAVLTMIGAYPSCSNADIARLSLMTPQTASFIIANLLKAGHLTRKQHATHGRIRMLALSDSGSALIEAARARVRAHETTLSAGLDAGEEAVIRRWLVQLAEGVEG